MKREASLGLKVALTGISAAAHAQSSVTLYDIVDVGISYMKTSTDSRCSMLSGGVSGNRWGLKGNEDLGGGLKAIFQLESGFAIGTGKSLQRSTEFGHQVFVGLSGDRWGSIVAGRMYDPIIDLVQPITADGTGGSVPFATPGDVDNSDFSTRVSNAIKFKSLNYSGFQFKALHAFSGVAGSTGQGYTFSGAFSYTHGPLKLAVGYFQATNANAASGKRTSWTSATTDALFEGGSINGAYQSARMLAITQVATQYLAGPFTLGAGYSNARDTSDGYSTFDATQKFNAGRIYGFYSASSSLRFGFGYILTASNDNASARYDQVSAGTFYTLSRATDVYAAAAFQHASGMQRTAFRGTQEAAATISSYGVDGAGN